MLKLWLKYRFILSLFVLTVYYSVGVILLLKGGSEGELIQLTPLTIIITSIILFLNHEKWSVPVVFTLFLIAVLGLGIEIVGINFGVPFGEYEYSSILGIQLFKTPILIGLNWLMLVYAVVMILHESISNIWIKAFIACLVLVGLDMLIEPVAINWNMWTWKKSDVPVQNYITWGIVAFIFSLMLSKRLIPAMKNKIALPVIVFQVLFFVILGVWS